MIHPSPPFSESPNKQNNFAGHNVFDIICSRLDFQLPSPYKIIILRAIEEILREQQTFNRADIANSIALKFRQNHLLFPDSQLDAFMDAFVQVLDSFYGLVETEIAE